MLSITDIIRLSWNTYTSKFKKYIPWIGLIFVFSVVGSLTTLYLVNILKVSRLISLISSGIISFIVYLLSFTVTVFLILYTNQFLNNKKAKFTLRDVLVVLWPAIWLSILVGLITAGGFILIIIPGILFTVWYTFVMYIAILEKGRGLMLLKESRELSRGRFWPVFGRLVLPNIFWALIAYLVLIGVFNILGLILNQSLVGQTALSTTMSAIVITISNLTAAFFAPLYLIVNVIVYREVKK